ncbi:MAG: tetratricopeptide repeat protein [Betaproteobacteria bacterium]|nr:tetratricopeptide repeat protein [Betaproteobacteria bacterium]
MLDAAQYFYVTGQGFAAIEPATEAVQVSRNVDQRALLRKALTLLGITQADTGNISAAVESYAKALEIARQLRDPVSECAVWINLGVALLYAAQYRDAIACFEHAIEMSSHDKSLAAVRPNAFSNIALCALHLEDFGRGIRAAETSVKESPEPVSAAEKLSRVLRENYYTRLLLEVNSLEKARERCDIARAIGFSRLTISQSRDSGLNCGGTVRGPCGERGRWNFTLDCHSGTSSSCALNASRYIGRPCKGV